MAPIAEATNGRNSHAVPSKRVRVAESTRESRIEPDAELVQYPQFTSKPKTRQDFLNRAKEVADLLHQDEAERDRRNVVPYRQIQLLKDAGLVTLLGPKAAGGGGQTWSEAYHVVRIVAQGDGSLGQLLSYHYIWFWAAALVGTDEQRARIDTWLTENTYFIGGAVNPRDADLLISHHPTDPSKIVFNGSKTFSTGSKVSDVTILEGTFEGASDDTPHVFAPVLSRQPGIVFGDEWVDVLGMRGTQSGGVKINQVEVPWANALGWTGPGQFHPLGAYNTLNLPTIQLIFTSFYLGITQGALARGLRYTAANTRAWPYAGQPQARGTDEFYIQSDYGTLQARVWASEAQIDKVVEEASRILHTEPRTAVTAEQRARFAVHVAAAKVVIADTGLELTSKVYELQGARSISGKYGFDVAYRDLRTHTLHDPIAHKRAEVGRYALLGPGEDGWAVPTWYT